MNRGLSCFVLIAACLFPLAMISPDNAAAEWGGSGPGSIVGGAGRLWFDSSGQAWNPSAGWTRRPHADLPVPVSQVKFLEGIDGTCCGEHALILITVTDEAWTLADPTNITQPWQYLGPFPGGPVTLDEDSWGKVKERYRE